MRNNAEACVSCIMCKTWYFLRYEIGLFQKKKWGMGVENMTFPGVLKENQVHFPGVNQKQCEIFRGDQEKVMWNFYKDLCFRP